jgi:hypothetical protein
MRTHAVCHHKKRNINPHSQISHCCAITVHVLPVQVAWQLAVGVAGKTSLLFYVLLNDKLEPGIP